MEFHRLINRSLPDRILAFLVYNLRHIGIDIYLYFRVREGESAMPPYQDSLFETGFLGRQDAGNIASVKQGGNLRETLQWFDEGKLCFGVKDGERIVAKMWCDLEAFHFKPEYRKLEADEVYLFAAAVSPAYRGRNLASLMRTSCYTALRKMGRTRFYSYTEYYNAAARRFKEKLGVRNQVLRAHVSLFKRWRKTWTIKEYSTARE